MGRVQNKVALITGGAMGLGQASARRLAEEGAKVVITDIADAEGQATADEINAKGGEAIYLHHDVTQEAEWIAIIDKAVSHFGGLHILVNNAGIMMGTRKENAANHELTMACNHLGHFLLTNLLLDKLQKSNDGRVIVVTKERRRSLLV